MSLLHAAPDRVDTLHYTRCPVPTASGVAIDTGRLAEEFDTDDIAVLSIRASADAAVRESHFSHDLPALFREGGNVPALAARSRGESTTLVGLTWVEEFQSLVANPGSAIASPSDLKGRRVLVPGHAGDRVDFGRAMALRGLDATLSLAGLTRDDVELVDVPTPVGDLVERGAAHVSDAFAHEVAALQAGVGDVAYVKGAPAIDLVRRLGLEVLHDLSAAPDPRHRINNGTPRTITVSTELLAARPDLVIRYLRVLLRASAWATSHAEETFTILAAETGAPVEAAVAAYGPRAHHELRPRLDGWLVDALADQEAWLRANGFLAGAVDVHAWFDPGPLRAALAAEAADTTTTEERA